MSVSFSKKCFIAFLIYFLLLYFLGENCFFKTYCDETKDLDSWVIAFSEFTLEGNVPELYHSYAKTIPELLSFYLQDDLYYTMPSSEKDLRQILSLTQKKLKAISELNALYGERDSIFLQPISEKDRQKKQVAIDKKIKGKHTEIEQASAEIKMQLLKAENKNANNIKKVVKYNEGSLYTKQPEKSLAVSLSDSGISALVSGSIKNISGYVVVNAVVETGFSEHPEVSVTEAGRYEEIDEVVKTIAMLLYSKLQSLPAKKLIIELNPPEAKLFISDVQVTDVSEPLTVYATSISVFATAEGYESAKNTFTFSQQNSYKLSISLRKLETVNLNIQTNVPSTLYTETQAKASTTKSIEDLPYTMNTILPEKKDILEFETEEGIKTFVVFDATNLNKSMSDVALNLNTKSVKAKIEKQRSIMYWSLGALYLSLPITLILNGVKNDQIASLNSGRLPNTQAHLNRVNALNISSNVMIGVTAGLAVNYFVQVILYLIKADGALPSVIN